MKKYSKQISPVLYKKDAISGNSWNWSDMIMGTFESCLCLLLKIALGTCLGIVLEILKFVLILLLTCGLALGIFQVMDVMFHDRTETVPETKSNPKKHILDLSNKNGSMAFPYLINYLSRSEEANFGSRRVAGRSNLIALDDDDSDDGIIHVGSFRRPEQGGMSLVGHALDDLRNAYTPINGTQHRSSMDGFDSDETD